MTTFLDLKDIIQAEVDDLNASHPRMAANFTQSRLEGVNCDYRLDDTDIASNSLTVFHEDKSNRSLLAVSTIIFIDQSIKDYFPILRLDQGNLFSAGVDEILHIPAVMVGYTETLTPNLALRVLSVRWFHRLLQRCQALDTDFYIEVTGQYDGGEINGLEGLIGSVNPQSTGVLTMARLLKMERVEGYFEFNTFGPLYRKARA
ncbi:MAG: hypothetical protein FWH40_06900 [Coriobacteriia bacterium]|nr:hypothetical protein [Coriobacteriia bacterium]